MCVCVRERERESEKGRDKELEIGRRRDRQGVRGKEKREAARHHPTRSLPLRVCRLLVRAL